MDILILSLAICRTFSNTGNDSQAEEFGKQIDGKTIVNIEHSGTAFLTYYKVTYADQNGKNTTTILDPMCGRIKTETSTDDQYHAVINNDTIILCVPQAELAHNSQYKSQ
jgi:hypothetical protein